MNDAKVGWEAAATDVTTAFKAKKTEEEQE